MAARRVDTPRSGYPVAHEKAGRVTAPNQDRTGDTTMTTVRRTTAEERARAMAVYATDDETRLHGSADETEVVMTLAGAAHIEPEPRRRPRAAEQQRPTS
jgi:hypothetical protein